MRSEWEWDNTDLGGDVGHGDVVRFGRDPVEDRAVAHADSQHVGAEPGKKPVVVAGPEPQTAAVAIEGQAGNQHGRDVVVLDAWGIRGGLLVAKSMALERRLEVMHGQRSIGAVIRCARECERSEVGSAGQWSNIGLAGKRREKYDDLAAVGARAGSFQKPLQSTADPMIIDDQADPVRLGSGPQLRLGRTCIRLRDTGGSLGHETDGTARGKGRRDGWIWVIPPEVERCSMALARHRRGQEIR